MIDGPKTRVVGNTEYSMLGTQELLFCLKLSPERNIVLFLRNSLS